MKEGRVEESSYKKKSRLCDELQKLGFYLTSVLLSYFVKDMFVQMFVFSFLNFFVMKCNIS